jgi:hypothetical protein
MNSFYKKEIELNPHRREIIIEYHHVHIILCYAIIL